MTNKKARLGLVLSLVAFSLAMVAAASAHAQDAVDMAAAKKEGKVVWYTSTPIATAQKVAKLFESESGIKVELFRSGGSAILSRFMQEYDAKRIAADVLTTSDPSAANAMAKKGMFVAFKPTDFDKIPDAAKDKDGYHIAQRLNMMTIFAREDKVAAGDLPKAWTDLTDAKYKGKLITSDPSFTSLQLSVVGTLSKTYGWKFYEDLRKNDIMVVQGNEQILDNLKRGERLIAAGALDSYAADARKEGHKIKTIYPADGTFVIPSPTSIVKGSPNPNAAKAFAAFMISINAQKLFPEDGGYAARVDVAPPAGSPDFKSLNILAVDYDAIEKQSTEIKNKFNEVFQ
ncbi:MAG: extracellular solute-binding protein [Gemmatimonas sp.]